MTSPFKLTASVAAALSLFGCGANAPEDAVTHSSSQQSSAMILPPMPVLDDGVRISAGLTSVASLHADGTVYTWGGNQYGQLGQATPAASPLPLMVRGLSSITALQSGGYHVAAIRTDGTVWTWGNNTYGQLGHAGGLSSVKATPLQVSGLSNVKSVAAGYVHSAAVTAAGAVWGWGSMPGRSSSVPVRISGIPVPVTRISAGSDFSIAVGSDGYAYAWGGNRSGQTGTGVRSSQVKDPVRVVGLSNALAISAGAAHALALRADGTVWAWGSNEHGQLGTGNADNTVARPVLGLPTPLAGASTVKAVIAGARNSAVVYRDGSVWIWGSNSNGQLGNGSTAPSSTPLLLNTLAGVAAVTVGDAFVSVLKTDGTVFSMGANSFGQLGNNTTTRSSVPVQVVGLSGAGYVNLGASGAR